MQDYEDHVGRPSCVFWQSKTPRTVLIEITHQSMISDVVNLQFKSLSCFPWNKWSRTFLTTLPYSIITAFIFPKWERMQACGCDSFNNLFFHSTCEVGSYIFARWDKLFQWKHCSRCPKKFIIHLMCPIHNLQASFDSVGPKVFLRVRFSSCLQGCAGSICLQHVCSFRST